jgi:hypothetical protein
MACFFMRAAPDCVRLLFPDQNCSVPGCFVAGSENLNKLPALILRPCSIK